MVTVSSCCCCCSLRTGTLTIAWLSVIGSALTLASTVKQFTQVDGVVLVGDLFWPDCSKDASCVSDVRDVVVGIYTYSLICNAVSITASVLLIYAVQKNRSYYMTPYILYYWISIVLNVLLFIGLIVFFAFYEPIVSIIVGIIMIIVTALNVYFLIVIRSYQTEMTNTNSAPRVCMQEEGKKEAEVWKR